MFLLADIYTVVFFFKKNNNGNKNKIWDFKSESRKPVQSIQTIAAVARVQWRPGHESQLASCSLSNDNRVINWDTIRPFIPIITLGAHENVTSGFLWHDSDSIWSCSKDRYFIQQDLKTGLRPLDHLSSAAFDWNLCGDLTFAMEERRRGEESLK